MGGSGDDATTIKRTTVGNAPIVTGTAGSVPVNMNADVVDQARKVANPAHKRIAVLNNSKGLTGEVVARDWVKATYGSRAQLRTVMLRTNGVPVMDLVFETAPGEFVVVEAKAHDSKLSFTNERVWIVDPESAVRPVSIAQEVEQVSPKWFRQRFEEMRGPFGDAESRRLANQLEASWHGGRMRVLAIRDFPNPKSTERAFQVLDYTDGMNADVGAVARHRVPERSAVGSRASGTLVERAVSSPGSTPEHRAKASHEAALRSELKLAQQRAKARALSLRDALKKASKRAKDLEAEAIKLEKAADRAEKTVKTAEANLGKAKLPRTIADRAAVVQARKAEAVRQRSQAALARSRAQKAAQAEAYLGKLARAASVEAAQLETDLGKRLRAASADLAKLEALEETRGLRFRGRPSAPGGAQAARAADDAAAAAQRTARGTGAPLTMGRKLENNSVTSVASQVAKEERTLATALAAESRAAKLGKLGGRVLSLTKNLGKLAVGFFVPLTKLEVLLQLAIWLLEWDQRRRRAEEEEWRRIYVFLFEFSTPLKDPFAKIYLPSVGDTFWGAVDRRLQAPDDPENILHWIRKWDSEPSWHGFVFAKISLEVIRNEHDPSAGSRAPNPIRYYANGALNPQFAEMSIQSTRTRTESPTRRLEPDDRDNMFTGGKSGDPAENGNQDVSLRTTYLYRHVESRMLKVHVTAPTPSLTPFHYLIFKCRDLMAETIRFISRFDEDFWDMPAFDDDGALSTYWYEDAQFPKPIDPAAAHYCLRSIHELLKLLGKHGSERESLQKGWDRRLAIVQKVYVPTLDKRPLLDIARALFRLAQGLAPERFRPRQDPELAYLSADYLHDAAMALENDFRRVYRDMVSEKNPARSHLYKYSGSLEG